MDDKEKDFVNEYFWYISEKALIMKAYGKTDGQGEFWHKGEIPNGNPGCLWRERQSKHTSELIGDLFSHR